MKTLVNGMYSILVALLMGVGVLLLSTFFPLLGFEAKVVKSGSMEPAIPTGSVVLIHPASQYVHGDVVTFGADTKSQIPTTHRIIAISGQGANAVVTTRGDANNEPDPATTRASTIIGKVVLTVPYLGYLLAFARTPVGFGLMVGLPALLIIMEEALAIVREVARIRRRKNEKKLRRGSGLRADAHSGYGNLSADKLPETSSPSLVRPPARTSALRLVPVDGIRGIARKGASLPVRHIAGTTLAVLLVAGLVSAVKLPGTVSYYRSVGTSAGNMLRASDSYPGSEAPAGFAASALSIESLQEDPPQDDPPAQEDPQASTTVETPWDLPAEEPEATTTTQTPWDLPNDEPPADVPPPADQTPDDPPVPTDTSTAADASTTTPTE